MDSILEDKAYQKQLERLTLHLQRAEGRLARDPGTEQTLMMLQNMLHFLALQTQWRSAGPAERMLMTLETALLGCETTDSVTGIFGPTFVKTQQGAAKLMQMMSRISMPGLYPLLLRVIQLVNSLALYCALNVMVEWKRYFPKEDPVAAKRGAALHQEIVIIFMSRAGWIEQGIKAVVKDLNWSEKGLKAVGDIGFFQTLLILFAVCEHSKETQETIMRLMKPLLSSIEKALQMAQGHTLLDEGQAFSALSYLQAIQLALEDENLEAFKEALNAVLQLQGLSYEDLKKDIKKVEAFASQLSLSFENIYNQTSQAVTSVTQAA